MAGSLQVALGIFEPSKSRETAKQALDAGASIINDVGALMFKITQEIQDMMQKWNVTLF